MFLQLILLTHGILLLEHYVLYEPVPIVLCILESDNNIKIIKFHSPLLVTVLVVIFVSYQFALYHMPKHTLHLVLIPLIQVALPTYHVLPHDGGSNI